MSPIEDKRARACLKTQTIYKFINNNKENLCWEINEILGYGATSIVYDVSNPDNPSKHYALKEYFPLSLYENVSRKDNCLVVEDSVLNKWNIGLENFTNEIKLQKLLPNSNTEFGSYFMYANNAFYANGTAYIIFDTDYSMTLSEYVENVFLLLENNPNKSISFLKTILKFALDVCTGVAILHDKGLLHLDISTSNIMINRKSEIAKLNDFASAVAYDKNTCIANSISFPSYNSAFSPIELKSVALGNRTAKINPSSDVYSIAAVLYKCLFNEVYDPILGVNSSNPIPICPHIDSNISRSIYSLLNRCLCGIEYRIQSAEKVKTELQHIINAIENLEEKKKLKKLGLVPSVSLAIGYYENFLQDTIYEMIKMKSITINGKSFDLTEHKKELEILIPQSHLKDWKEIANAYYRKENLVKIQLEGLRGISVVLDYDALIKQKKFRILDIPLTLRSSFRAVDFIAKNNGSENEQRKNEEKNNEIESFINTLKEQAMSDVIVSSILTINRVDI